MDPELVSDCVHCVLGHRFFGPAETLLRRVRTA